VDQTVRGAWVNLPFHEKNVSNAGIENPRLIWDNAFVVPSILQLPDIDMFIEYELRAASIVARNCSTNIVVAVPPATTVFTHDVQFEEHLFCSWNQLHHHSSYVKKVLLNLTSGLVWQASLHNKFCKSLRFLGEIQCKVFCATQVDFFLRCLILPIEWIRSGKLFNMPLDIAAVPRSLNKHPTVSATLRLQKIGDAITYQSRSFSASR